MATHNRAGEITYEHLGGLKYRVTIVTYTKISAPADRDSLELDWGDGSPLESIPRSEKNDALYGNRDNKTKYLCSHAHLFRELEILSYHSTTQTETTTY